MAVHAYKLRTSLQAGIRGFSYELRRFEVNHKTTCRHDYLVLPTVFAFVVLLSARLISALFNLIHDCDEVYNYWEPLHYLLYGYGMQTWEYRSDLAFSDFSVKHLILSM